MMQDGRFAIPIAILLGLGLVSLAVWRAGVRIGEAIDASRLAQASTPAPTVISGPPSPGASAQATPQERSAQDQELGLRDEAQEALARQQVEYQRRCAPRIPAAVPPEHGSFAVELRFDAQGLEISRTFRVDGPWPAPNWLACTKELKLPPVRVTSIGRPATVTAQLTLP